MPTNNRIHPITLGTVDAGTLVLGVWSPLKVPVELPLSYLRIVNNNKLPVFISYDGVNAHDFIQADDVLELNFQVNSLPNAHVANLANQTGIYVTGNAGAGAIYCSGFSSYIS